MATRITHTNNSDGHDGTYVYRSTSPMDPQNLPAPIADEPPVALGAVFEYIDTPTPDATYYYRTQDYEGGQVSVASDEVSIDVPADYDNAQIGDEIGGGIYAGSITYADARQFHIVSSKSDGEASGLQWKTSRTETTGTSDADDGLANTQSMESAGISDHPAGEHCVNYAGGDKTDWYLPARNELTLLYNNLAGHAEFADNVGSGDYTWSSTEGTSSGAWSRRFSDGAEANAFKDATNRRTRPIRRVPV